MDAVIGLSYGLIPAVIFIYLARRTDNRRLFWSLLSVFLILATGTLLAFTAPWPLDDHVYLIGKAGLAVLTLGLVATVCYRQGRASTGRALSRLVDSEKRFQAALEASLDGVIFYGPIRENGRTVDLRVYYANTKAAHYCRSTPEAMQGRLISEILPGTQGPGGMIECHGKVADTREPLEYLLDYDADGIRAVFRNLVVAFDGFVAATFRDVTASVQANRALEQAKLTAEQANEAKSRFLAAASHDLRQPLQALSLYLGVLGQRVPADSLPIMRHIDICVASLSELLSDLLDLSKLDAGVVQPKFTHIRLSDILESAAASHAGTAREKGLRLRMVSSDLSVCTDVALFERIITNLVSNAVRYTHEGGVVIGGRRRGGRRWLVVADSGIGIPEDMQDVIFEEFRQLGNPERSREKGSGLGLAIVRRTARLLGLEIQVSSIPDRGSCFWLELPFSQVAPATDGPLPTQACHRRLRIALVEDDLQVREALRLALEQDGHEVIEGVSGYSVLNALGDRTPDAVIADYNLGEERTGLDAVAGVRAAFGETIPAIILTGETGLKLVDEISLSGVRVVHKPIRIDDMRQRLMEVLPRHSTESGPDSDRPACP